MKTNLNNFAVFILTHGRPNNVMTLKTLKKCGYTGEIFLIVDNEDQTINKYIKNFGIEKVKIFDKKQIADSVDEGNNFDERRTITHARNACFNIAKEIGIKYFIQLDDDYSSFRFRFLNKNKTKLISQDIYNLNYIFKIFLKFYISTSFKSLAFAQGGDFIGGVTSGSVTNGFNIRRKCMNSFICSTDRPFKFIGAMNEDVNTYTTLGSRGFLFGTIPLICLNQKQTQSQSGGITDMYLRFGTYCKAFTTTMMMPSSVLVSMMPSKNNTRIHHSIKWKNTTPMIISEKHKK